MNFNSLPIYADEHPQSTISPQQSLQSWIAIGALIIFTIASIAVGAGKLLNVLFPLFSFFVAVFLYKKDPVMYVGFTWWMWFITSLVRRLADWKSGFTDPSPLLLAPYLVSLVSGVTVLTKLKYSHQEKTTPFLFAIVAVFYGFLVGLVNKPGITVFKGFLEWITPLSFGFHLMSNWHLYPKYKRNIQTVFLWGILLMSIYGVLQFIELPEWDKLWLKETGLESATGAINAEGGGVRIWSTMQSPEPFAGFLSGGLLILLSCSSGLGIPVSVLGSLTFLVARIRSGWVGFVVGLFSFATSMQVKNQIRLFLIVTLLGLCIVPLVSMEQFSDSVGTRMETLANVQEDDSATGRQEMFREGIGAALVNFTGSGLEASSMDNTILAALTYLGWIGTIPYFLGLIMMILRAFKSSIISRDLFAGAARGAVMSTLVRIPVNGPHMGISGFLMWGFLGLILAAELYEKDSVSRQYLQFQDTDSDLDNLT